jgi:multidrug resistance efflux pump
MRANWHDIVDSALKNRNESPNEEESKYHATLKESEASTLKKFTSDCQRYTIVLQHDESSQSEFKQTRSLMKKSALYSKNNLMSGV